MKRLIQIIYPLSGAVQLIDKLPGIKHLCRQKYIYKIN